MQIIEDSANYQFGFNHSTGYSMIGYTCAFLRYYYPTEFIAAYLNNANNDDDIQMGTQLAEFKHIPILPPKFRHSKDVYVPDAKEKKIYKGLSSIKFLSSDIASQLYEMRDMKFDSFVDFLKVSPLNSKQLYILTVLDFFSEFGDVGKLLAITDIYNTYSGKKLLKKEICVLPHETILQFATETEKQYRITDSAALVSHLCENAKPKEFTLSERLASELEYLGYLSFKSTDARDKYNGYVCSADTKFSPKITVYNLYTGKTETIKCYKKTFAEQPLAKGMIITYYTESKQKSRMNPETKQFEKIPNEFEQWFKWYQIKEYPPKETK